MIEAGLITARFLHFSAVMALFGLALFPLYSYPASGNPPLARLSRWQRTSLWCAAFLALASALAWGWLTIAAMTGTMTAAGADSLLTVLRPPKVCLLGGMLALAVQNRFRFVPALQRWKQGSMPVAAPMRVFRRNALIEQTLGLGIVLILGWLGPCNPPCALCRPHSGASARHTIKPAFEAKNDRTQLIRFHSTVHLILK